MEKTRQEIIENAKSVYQRFAGMKRFQKSEMQKELTQLDNKIRKELRYSKHLRNNQILQEYFNSRIYFKTLVSQFG